MMAARRSDSDPMAGDEDGDDEVVEVELHGHGSGGTTATGFRYILFEILRIGCGGCEGHCYAELRCCCSDTISLAYT